MITSPFVGSEALAEGLISERAMRRMCKAVYPNVYMDRTVEISARERATAAWLWSKRRGIVAGLSAAAMLGGKWIDGSAPAELIHDNRRPPPNLIVRNERALADELVRMADMRLTAPARTGFDLGRHIENRIIAVQRLDALANATDVKVTDIEAVIAAHPGARGIPRLRRVLPLVDSGAESPQETLARLVLIDAGLPTPKTQFRVVDEYGQFVARFGRATSTSSSRSTDLAGSSSGRVGICCAIAVPPMCAESGTPCCRGVFDGESDDNSARLASSDSPAVSC
jgi:hypothetical protein